MRAAKRAFCRLLLNLNALRYPCATRSRNRPMRRVYLLVCLLLWSCCASVFAAEHPLTVFAAASLRESLDSVAHDWEASGHGKVVVSYAASSALAKQIEQGAPASRFILVRNALVLIAPATSPLKPLDPSKRGALIAALGTGRLAVAETSSVPAGKYARQSLEKLGLWSGLSMRLAQGENVRAALEFVARGDTPLGIVYLTDARAEPRVKVLAIFADKTHAPIVYPAARTSAAADPKAAAAFLEFLRGKQAAMIFRRAGFIDGR
jgi:molybdate transport system substrate-binding protein